MKVIDTAIAEVKIIEPRVFEDERGFFFESFNQQRFEEAIGYPVEFVQDNHSRSSRGVLRGLGWTGPVKSPSYTLLEHYPLSSIYLYHFDFYRFNEPEEFEDAGLGEYFRENAVCLVEWPDKARGYVPAADLDLVFRFPEALDGGRILDVHARSEAGRQCLNGIRSRWSGAVS